MEPVPDNPAAHAVILIVDDDAANRKLLEALLKYEGHSTLGVATGEQAFAAIALHAPALILLDIMLPGMDGYQVAARLKADPETASIPIIMVTQKLDREAHLAGLRAGVEEFLTKPIDRAELWLRVRNLLRLKTFGDLLQNQSAALEQQVRVRTSRLLDSEKLLDSIVENIPSAVQLKSVQDDFRILIWNKAAEAMYGLSRAEAVGRSVHDLWPKSDADLMHAADLDLVATGIMQDFPDRLAKTRTRGDIHVRMRKLALHDADGKATHLLVVADELTAQLANQAQLRESERRFSAMLANVELASVMLDIHARITYCNEYFLRLTGWHLDDVVGKDWFKIFMPAELGDMKPVFAALLKDQPGAWHRDNEIFTRAGERRMFRWNNSVLRSGSGEVVGTASIGEDITEQKRAEDLLRKSEARFRSLTELSSDWFWEQDEEHRFVRFSGGEGVKGWGPDQEQAVGLHRWDLGGAIPIGSSWDAHKRTLDAHKPFRDFEYSRILGDGRLQYVEASGEPIFEAGGRFAGYRGVATEITGRKLAEQDQDRQQSELRALFDLMPAMIWFKDTENRILRVNRRVADAAGKTVAQIEGRPSSEIYPQDAARFYADDLAVMKSGVPRLGYVETLQGANGEQRWVQTDKVPYFDHRGKVMGVVVMAQDITERKRGEHDLQRFRTAMDSSGDGIVLVDRASMRYIDVNKTLCDMVGYTRDELIGMTPMELFGVERASLERDYDAVIANRSSSASLVEGHYRHKNGTTIPVETRRRAMLADGGWIIVGSARDITGQRLAEYKIRRQNRVYAMLSEVNALIVRVHDREELFREACRVAVEIGLFAKAWLGVVVSDTRQFSMAAALGGDPLFFVKLAEGLAAKFQAGEGLVARAVATRRPVISNDAANDTEVLLREHAGQGSARSLAILPLIVSGEVVGVFTLNADTPDFFDREEMKLLTQLADDIAHAIDNIDRAARLARITRVNAVLSGITSAIVRTRDRSELYREVCRIAIAEGEFILARVVEVTKRGKASISATSETDTSAFQGFLDAYNAEPARSGSMIGLAIRSGQPLISNDVAGDPRIPSRAALTANGNYALALLPITIDGRVASVIVLHAQEAGAFNDDEMRLLVELVSNLSFALELMEKRKRIEYLAYHDDLTGFANRALFQERLLESMAAAREHGRRIALVLIDIERFKNINDTLGRPAGDALLKEFGARIAGNAEGKVRIARIDADHFAVIVPEMELESELASRIERRAADVLEPPFLIGSAELRISAKYGIAMFPADGADADTLFRNAEAALKKAKATGERFLYYTQDMNERIAERLTLENQLRQALDKSEFVLHYQPKISLVTGRLTSAEALIRWNNPRTGLVPPGQFIPILEETGLIYEVGRWALRQAIKDYLRWRAAGLPVVRIAVNVSPMQLRNLGFIAEIKQVVGVDAGAPAGLELEITESLIMEDVKRNIDSLRAIRAMGVTIAIDDFGTGFSSLSYLAKLPVDALKIDRSFVVDMTGSPQGLSLVSTIISLAHSLKLKVVAEGVETEEQSRLLKLLRCDEMQGFLFSKPVPAETFEKLFLAPAGSANHA